MIEVKYDKVVELKDSFHPLYDYRTDHRDEDLTTTIFISDKQIQFYSPLQANIDDKSKYVISLKRDDTITGYTNHLDEPLWRVEKNWATGRITLWPSIIWGGSDPKERQHFWFRDMKATVLGDSWIFKTNNNL